MTKILVLKHFLCNLESKAIPFRDESPEPKNTMSYKETSLTKDSEIDEKCYLRISGRALCIFLHLAPI